MAGEEKSGGSGPGGAWSFGKLWDTVREQTNTLVESVETALGPDLVEATKRDLGIFVSTIKDESTHAIAETSTTIATTLHVAPPMGLARTSSSPTSQSDASAAAAQPKLTRRELFVLELQSSPTVFLTEPSNMVDFDEWENAFFDMESKGEEIAALLQGSPKLAAIHTNLVPRVVEQDVFWQRYFFKLYQFDAQEAERREIQRKAEEKLLSSTAADELAWDDDEEGSTEAGEAESTQPAASASETAAGGGAHVGPGPATVSGTGGVSDDGGESDASWLNMDEEDVVDVATDKDKPSPHLKPEEAAANKLEEPESWGEWE